MSSLVAFCGSRSLPSSAWPLVARVVASVLRSGRGVAVGCCRGADAAVLSSVLAVGGALRPLASGAPALRVFAVFGPGGAGALWHSAVGPVCRAAALAASGAPVSVRWWAGSSGPVPSGGGSVPAGGLPVPRLRARSFAVVSATAASGPGAGLVAFFGPAGSGRGSLLACRAALRRGLPVFAFACGLSAAALPALATGGSWVPAASSGVWASGFRWAPGVSPSSSPSVRRVGRGYPSSRKTAPWVLGISPENAEFY